MPSNEKSQLPYWNKRVEEYGTDLLGMVMCDSRAKLHQEVAESTLRLFTTMTVMDVGCGWGRFSPLFGPHEYYGIDFSDKMVELAQSKFPGKHFKQYDFHQHGIESLPEVDVIFEVISLSSLEMTPQEFYEQFKSKAKVAIMCLEFHQFHLFYI